MKHTLLFTGVTLLFALNFLCAESKPPSWRGFQGEGFPEMRRAWDSPLPAPAKSASDARIEAAFRLAEQHARQAHEAFFRSRRFVDGWLARGKAASSSTRNATS